MPFCRATIKGLRPLPPAYPEDPQSLGEHLKRRRMDLGLTAKQVAARLGATKYAVWDWEWGRRDPRARYLPAIVDFLGYAPLPTTGFSAWLRAARRARGLTQVQLAACLGVNRSTIHQWERGHSTLGSLQPATRKALLGWLSPSRPTLDAVDFSSRTGLSGKLRAARLRMGLTQKQLAGLAGVHERTIRNCEQGRSRLHDRTIARLQAVIEDLLAVLVGG